jgi:hypothetical protein
MSDPRLPIEEQDGLGEIDEDIEGIPADDESAEDAPDDLDEAGDGTQEEEDEDPVAERRQTRGQSRQATLARENRELRTQLTTFQSQLDEIRNRPAPQTQVDPYAQQRAAEAEQARLANMSYEERVDYLRGKDRQEVAQALQGIEFRMADRADKLAWDASLRDNPTRTRLAPEVERAIAQYRAEGKNADRETVYKYLRGEEMDRREREGRGNIGRQRTQAQRRVARQTTRPASGRGGEGRAAPARSGDDADLRFLKNTRVGDVV